MDSLFFEEIVKIISPIFTVVTSVIAAFVSYKFGFMKSRKEDQLKIYQSQLHDVYYPIHKQWLDAGLYKKGRVNETSIADFLHTIGPIMKQNDLLIPGGISGRFNNIIYDLSVGRKKRAITLYREFISLNEDQFNFVKKKLGYPTIGFHRQMSSWSIHKQLLFVFSIIFLFLGTIALELIINFAHYTFQPVIFTVSMLVLGVALFIIFLVKEV